MSKNKLASVSLWTIICIVLLAGLGFYYWKTRQQMPPQMQMPAPAVTVDKPKIETVQEFYDYSGNVEAVEFVEIRARVEGFINEIHFTDGSFVEQGQLLFEIEPDVYNAAFAQAQATLLSAKAQLESADSDLKRVEEAIKSNAVSIEEVSRRKAQRDIAAAQVALTEAGLENAKIQLGYTKIHSPISGKISRRLVDKGNLVGAGENTMLTTVVKTNPVYVTFEMSETDFAKFFQAKTASERMSPQTEILIAGPNDNDYTHKGTLDYVDNVISRSTGTISLRCTVENQEGLYYPGMFVRLRLPGRTIENALLVEDSAIGTNLGGKYVLTVGKDNIVSAQQVAQGMLYGTMRLIESGLTKDDTYITRGLQWSRPGTPVNPQQAQE